MTKGKKHFILIKIEQRAREIRCPITFVLMNVFTINALRIVCYKSIMCVCPFNKTQNTKTKEDNFLLYLIYYVCLSVFDWFGYFCLNVSRAGICGNYYFYFIIYIKCAPTCLMVSHIKKCMFSRSLFHTYWRKLTGSIQCRKNGTIWLFIVIPIVQSTMNRSNVIIKPFFF